MEENITKHINDEPDSIEVGTAGKGGCIKAYGNFKDPDGFKIKIDNAVIVREYAKQKLAEQELK